MKMLMVPDDVYYKICRDIRADEGLKSLFAAQGMKHGVVTNPVPWYGTLANMFLNGAVDVPDEKQPKLKIRQFEFVRYGWDADGDKKNVLYTIKDETKGVVYYGVSRCDLRYDQFKRAEGIKLAKERAERARTVGHNLTPRVAFCNHARGARHTAPMYGVARLDKVKELIEWFDGIG